MCVYITTPLLPSAMNPEPQGRLSHITLSCLPHALPPVTCPSAWNHRRAPRITSEVPSVPEATETISVRQPFYLTSRHQEPASFFSAEESACKPDPAELCPLWVSTSGSVLTRSMHGQPCALWLILSCTNGRAVSPSLASLAGLFPQTLMSRHRSSELPLCSNAPHV